MRDFGAAAFLFAVCAVEGGEVVRGFGVCVEGDGGEVAFHSRKGEA